MKTRSDLDYFPKDYADSRARFVRSVSKLEGPVQAANKAIPGKKDPDLAVDDVYLPPTGGGRDRLVVLILGIHGLEAYAGSAIQSLFLDEILPKIDRRSTGVYVVHSMNPYGFKHHTRYTENNVNLNRNCGVGDALYGIRNALSLRMSDRFCPKERVTSLQSNLLSRLREEAGRILFDDVSLDEFIKAVGPGQFESEVGLEFGGFRPEPQTAFFTERLRQILPGYKDVLVFDLHTGLGERGRLHLLTGERADSLNKSLLQEVFHPLDDRQIYDFTPNESEGFYKTDGATNDLFPQVASADQRICAVTMEFGTLGHSREAMLESLNRWMLEHQGHHHGYGTPDLEKEIKRLYLEKFFPSDETWRSGIVATSRELFRRVFERAGVSV